MERCRLGVFCLITAECLSLKQRLGQNYAHPPSQPAERAMDANEEIDSTVTEITTNVFDSDYIIALYKKLVNYNCFFELAAALSWDRAANISITISLPVCQQKDTRNNQRQNFTNGHCVPDAIESEDGRKGKDCCYRDD